VLTSPTPSDVPTAATAISAADAGSRGPSWLVSQPGSRAATVAERADGHRAATPIVGAYLAAWLVLSSAFVMIGLLLTDVVLGAGRDRRDEAINQWLADHRTTAVNNVTRVVTLMANTIPVVVMIAVVCALLLAVRWWRAALFIASAITLEVTVFLTANHLVARDRPNVPRLDSTPSTGSYPSGHVGASLVLWCGVALVITAATRVPWARVLVCVVALLMTVLVGFARTYRGMHHLSDVLVGVLLGASALVAATFVVRVVDAVVQRRRAADAPALQEVSP
jgi:membrane-associated phospholipid phosphatase